MDVIYERPLTALLAVKHVLTDQTTLPSLGFGLWSERSCLKQSVVKKDENGRMASEVVYKYLQRLYSVYWMIMVRKRPNMADLVTFDCHEVTEFGLAWWVFSPRAIRS